jgi:hypothetical protein
MSDVTTTETAATAQDNTNVTPPTDGATAPSTETTGETQDSLINETEQKPDGDKADDTLLGDDVLSERENESESETEAKGAPDDYGDFEVLDGYEIPEENYKQFTEFGKKQGFSKDQMQAILNYDMDRSKAALEANANKTVADKEAHANKIAGYIEALKKQHGVNLKEVSIIADRAFNLYFHKDIRKELVDAGLSKHPALFNALHDIGKTISEDSIITGDTKVKGKNEGGIKSFFSDLNTKNT